MPMKLKSLTWNLEGIKRNIFNLNHFLLLSSPDLVFLSEPNIFSHDLEHLKLHFSNRYNFYLNSEDKFDNEAPFIKNRTYGGTMVLWKHGLDPYISVHPATTTSFLPIVYTPPGSPITVHIALYLPTSGQESQFLEQLMELRVAVEDLKEKYPESILFIRGDSNVNSNNKVRSRIFAHFCSELKLLRIPTQHNTYHNFLGDGLFDSDIDVILQSSTAEYVEEILDIFCKNDYPEIYSSHDIIVSSVCIPSRAVPAEQELLDPAPTIVNSRHKIVWTEELVPEYESQVASRLAKLREDWDNPTSTVSVSILLDLTNKVLSQTASSTCQSVALDTPPKTRYLKIPKNLKEVKKQMDAAHRAYKKALKLGSPELALARSNWNNAKKSFRAMSRRETHKQDVLRDTELFSLFSSSSSVFKKIRSSKSSSSGSVPFLMVGDKKYPAHQVGDGLFASISSLKSQDISSLNESPNYDSWSKDYKYILEICKNKQDIPSIPLEQSSKILQRMKSSVIDFWSITPLHFINAGEEGFLHFNFLMNKVISNINSCSAKELNTVLALLLHKGHGKPKTSDRAYRTISTCPVLSKGLDMFLHDLFVDLWNSSQAETQYQGEGSSHELASLMITEAIQHSLYSSKKPVFMLLLDARSAFDTVVIEFLVRNLYLMGMTGHSLLYLNDRLTNRITYCDWERRLMGPIRDEHGVEQGGVPSSDLYKAYNNDLLITTQRSEQGVDLGDGLTISSVGQADDVGLLANCIYSLFNILQLALIFCQAFHIELCADKTKLLLITNQES